MVKSPEEHFNSQDFSPVADSGEYTPAERLFMIKYLGVEVGESGILEPPSPPDVSDNLNETKSNTATVVADAMLDLKSETDDLKAPADNTPEVLANEELEAKETADADEVEAIAIMETQLAPATLPPSAAETEAALPQQDPVAAPSAETPETSAKTPVEEIESTPELPVRSLTAEEQARKDFADTMLKDPPLEVVLKDEEYVQMVGFYIGDQEFVVPTMAMQEVIRYEAPIRIPLAPNFVEGVISLRGRVTPVVNLRDMLMVRNAPLDGEYCIIICLRRGMQLGFLVEKIHTLYRVPQKDLEWGVESHLGINSDVDFISAIMKSEDGSRLLGMLSVDKIIEFILR